MNHPKTAELHYSINLIKIISMEQQSSNLDSVMDARDHLINGVSSKNHMSREHFNKLKFALLTLITIFIFASCSKDKDTTYTFIHSADDVSGVSTSAIIYEYNDKDEVVGQQSFDTHHGLTKVFTANSVATKVKVRLSINSNIRWIKQVFYLNNGKNINIEMKGETIITNVEP